MTEHCQTSLTCLLLNILSIYYLRGEGDLGAGILLAVYGVGVAEVPAGVDAALLLGAEVAQLALRCNGHTVCSC